MKFAHIADAHIGYQQYGMDERFDDFGMAFESTIDDVIEWGANFVVFAGDLFQKHSLPPAALSQAVGPLEKLKKAGIPFIAVEGNHERASYSDRYSWLDYLVKRNLIVLLTTKFHDSIADVTAWDGSYGTYIDIGPVRVYGLQYMGTSTINAVDALAPKIQALGHTGYTIFVTHAGLTQIMRGSAGVVPYTVLSQMREYVDYVALGHIHKPYERDGWAFSPGSLETCSIDESQWPYRGYYRADVNGKEHAVELVQTKRRNFVVLRENISDIETIENLTTFLLEKVCNEIEPVITITLTGLAHFNLYGAEWDNLRDTIKGATKALLVRVKNETVTKKDEIAFDSTRMTKQQIEDEYFLGAAGSMEEFAKMDPTIIAQSMREFMNLVLAKAKPETIVAQLTADLRAAEKKGA